MAEPGVRRANSLGAFLSLSTELFAGEDRNRRSLRQPDLFAEPHPRLGHAASFVTRVKRRRQIIPAVCRVLEPRPTKDLDDDSRQTPNPKRQTRNAKRQTSPQAFDLLQHSFGDLADLAGSQEREMQQLEQ
jgi:hypothetical protein